MHVTTTAIISTRTKTLECNTCNNDSDNINKNKDFRVCSNNDSDNVSTRTKTFRVCNTCNNDSDNINKNKDFRVCM